MINFQANIKIAHLEEQLGLISEAAEQLAAGGAASLQLTPQFSQQHLQRLVRGTTPGAPTVSVRVVR